MNVRSPFISSMMAFTIAIASSHTASGAGDLVSPRPPAPQTLRFEERALERLAEQGLARSATLRALVQALERTQVIVFATTSRNLSPGVAGRVRFIGHGRDG